MPDPITISTEKPQHPGLDYEELRKRGLAYIEKIASAQWTDYNIHDPGITTLELLSYALTELSYRASFSIPDLLATESNTAQHIREHFISAAHILPNKPVTGADYRKLLIDIKGIKNAWLKKKIIELWAHPAKKQLDYSPLGRNPQPVHIKGCYEVLLEFDTNIHNDQKISIRETARQLLAAHRNLCEDVTELKEIAKEPLRLCAEIDLEASADPFGTLAQVFFAIQVHLTPNVRFYSLQKMLAAGYSADQIYEGPLLSHGFLKNDELEASELKNVVYLSDIMQIVMNVSGVKNISDIIISPVNQSGELANKWIIDIAEGSQANIDPLLSNMVIYKNGMPFRPDPGRVNELFLALMADYINQNDAITSEDITYDTGTFSNIEDYFSFQHHYPKNYGIGHWGLPPDAGPQRVVQARQLQAYLYFFDQHMANYLSQLAHTARLFSVNDEQQTFFTQPVTGINDAATLFVSPGDIAAQVQTAAENSNTFFDRRNKFLDHLLSRYAESFFEYADVLQTVFPSVNQQELIDTKIRFLRGYPEYSSHRFAAGNYHLADQIWNTGNVSGLEKRLQRLLGFEDMQRRHLVHHYKKLHSHTEGGATQYWYEIVGTAPENVLLVITEKAATEALAGQKAAEAARHYSNADHYTTVNNDGTINIELRPGDRALAASPHTFETEEAANEHIGHLTALLSQPSVSEGMFVIEHLLLLPPALPEMSTPPNCFLPICTDPDSHCCDTDPYSFRLSIVLPAYATRFLNLDFRNYCERQIRIETPAHLLPKICWINNEQLYELEHAYRDWLSVKAGSVEDKDQLILARLVQIVSSLRTVYPPARLQECNSTEETSLFLLNRNALGTLKK